MRKNSKYRYKNDRGYILVKEKTHPRAFKGYVFEHILIAEKALGKYLPTEAVVHHVDGNPANNNPLNLVICPNQGYHNLLHKRTRAKKACGNANFLLCNHCGGYDDPKNLYVAKRGNNAFHRKCRNTYTRKLYHAKKEATNG